MANIEKQLLKELSRFNQINHNSQNLEEQLIGGVANLGMGSHVERLLKRAKALGEQEDIEAEEEIPTDPEAEGEELSVDVITPPEADAEGNVVPDEGGEEVPVDDEVIDIDTEAGTEETKELDVTDLVNKDDEISDELTTQTDILSKNTESLNDLMSKLGDLEGHLASMDDMVSKISRLEDKLEEYRPRTPEEKMGLRKHDSGPYNKTLSDFFTDKEEVFDKTGKKQYILTPEEVEDYSEQDIKKSFDIENDED